MKLAYQIATPDVHIAPGVTAYQGDLEASFRAVSACGYHGAELMVCNPGTLDAQMLLHLAQKYRLEIPMVCTGEIFGQDGLCFSDPDDPRREEALRRTRDAVDLASKLGAQVNIGRLRGGHMFGHPDEICLPRAVDGIRQTARYAQQKHVTIAVEPVNPIASNFINTTQEGLALIQEIHEPNCTLMLDSNHMFISDLDILQSIRDARGNFSYVHLVDSNRLYPGNCKLDFAAFLRTLQSVGYDGWLSVEVFQRPDQDTALRESYRYLAPLLSTLH